MKVIRHIGFWLAVTLVLTLYYGHEDGLYGQAFFFSTFLLPIAIGVAYFFNGYLVPAFLLTQQYLRFILYTLYTLIIGVYLEMLVAMFSFVVLANYRFEGMNALSVDIFALGGTLFLIVLIQSFFSLVRQVQEQQKQLNHLESEGEVKSKEILTITVDRKQVHLDLDKVRYIESLSDYVKVHTEDASFITRERISHLSETLPPYFIRIHRSFLVNMHKVEANTREYVELEGKRLPISRSYRKMTIEQLPGGS